MENSLQALYCSDDVLRYGFMRRLKGEIMEYKEARELLFPQTALPSTKDEVLCYTLCPILLGLVSTTR